MITKAELEALQAAIRAEEISWNRNRIMDSRGRPCPGRFIALLRDGAMTVPCIYELADFLGYPGVTPAARYVAFLKDQGWWRRRRQRARILAARIAEEETTHE